MTFVERIRRFRRRLVERALRRSDGNLAAAADRLGCSRVHLSVLMHRLEIKGKDFKPLEATDLPADLRRDRHLGIVSRRAQ